MSKITPSIPKGTRDFTPEMVMKRNYIFGVIKNVFEKYGFVPLETPAMENLSTLTGKYGEEGDKLLFRILNSGDFLSDTDDATLQSRDFKKISSLISKKGLRYDLTVPLARYVVMHQNEISFPFKRYQIQPVWRADRPQKGRYQEFYQCDADVIGSDSLINEAELIEIYAKVFTELKVGFQVRYSNRKVLHGLCELYEVISNQNEFISIIDKVEKIGPEKVFEQMISSGYSEHSAGSWKNDYTKIISVGNLNDIRQYFEKRFTESEIAIGMDGMKELKDLQDILTVFNKAEKERGISLFEKGKVYVDFALARGLNYYTGTIIEVKPLNSDMGSIGGGGRYDNLTELFGLPKMTGVGISFGIERIYDIMEEMNLFPETISSRTKVLFINERFLEEIFLEEQQNLALKYVSQLRALNINAEIFPDKSKREKQLKYAHNKKIPFVVFMDMSETKKEWVLSIKNMETGLQENVSFDEIINQLR